MSFLTLLRLGSAVFFLIALSSDTSGQTPRESVNFKRGILKGTVIDSETGATIESASIKVLGTLWGDVSDSTGLFRIADLPVGSYSIEISCVGYETRVESDIIVRAGRTTVLNAKLQVRPYPVNGIRVFSGYFVDSPAEPTSATRYSFEEIRRSPGSAGDISRVIFGLPSVAKVNDLINYLVVRGGSPEENSFYIDNTRISNINHFPFFGATGGPISLVNIDLINEVNFSAGGYSAAFGDCLSSVTQIDYREGSREEVDVQADLNIGGFGLIAEGPIPGSNGSWIFAGRRSFLDLIADLMSESVVPRYSDYQGKLVLDVSPRDRISLFGILGDDYVNFEGAGNFKGTYVYIGWLDSRQFASGLTWRHLWGNNGYSNTTLSYLSGQSASGSREAVDVNDFSIERAMNDEIQLRNLNFFRIDKNHDVQTGIDLNYISSDLDLYYGAYRDFFGRPMPPLTIKRRFHYSNSGMFLNYTVRPWSKLTLTFGIRSDYSDYTENLTLSPRAAISYRLSERTRLNAAAGVYHQGHPPSLLVQKQSNLLFDDLLAYHAVLGIERLFAEDTRCRIEGYYKWYYNFPMNAREPELFIIDEIFYNEYWHYHPDLRDDGRARSYGVELTIQKKFRRGVYGLLGGSWFRSQYRDLLGIWRNRVFDNRIILSAEGGYKPNDRWEFSLRWIFAGGCPYTPIESELSDHYGREIHDRRLINEFRYPDYHSLNLRVDRRFNFKKSNVILYISAWNVYDRKNIFTYYWDYTERKVKEVEQWRFLPLVGIEFEF